MADPTKGPWKLSEERGGYRYLSGGNWEHFARVVVAISDDGFTEVPFPEGEANARLIALAPEMRDLLTELERTTVPDGSGNSWCAFCRVVRYEERSSHTATCRLGNLLKRMEE